MFNIDKHEKEILLVGYKKNSNKRQMESIKSYGHIISIRE